ncbi:unnamed protein product [Anisakis simplex]|uniref:SAC domain-containing protein n=1 Tax=Anisakis simplex TaxID=6269 RepID=A0A3P6Q655_ANISI|nr:unnamed protein product [Anisakis simplex]
MWTNSMRMRLRHLSVYETGASFYIVGSDVSQKNYHVLKIDRKDSRELAIGEPDHLYSKNDVMELLATISEGSSIVFKSHLEKRSSATENKHKGLMERASNAFGIVGVVRFLEGYYIVIATKARMVASFGYHSIYKIEEVAMVQVAADGPSTNPDEQRYLKIFQSVDLTTDFYFSYTYDLSRTLQENVTQKCGWRGGVQNESTTTFSADQKFVWNRFLLEPLRSRFVSEQWMLEIVHGYVGQQIIELPCARLSLTLIGRRSSEYAGTRYLKRGSNFQGNVANDVETEQIIWDMWSSPNFLYGKFSAFVQRRGSVPLLWSQDPATRGVVGKPLISIDINEPTAQTAAAHFRELRKKYGFPIIVMNLVKRREKRRHEAVLHDQFLKAVKYLNQFTPGPERIAYLSFDVARCNRTGLVINRLEEVGLRCVIRHGWFQTFPRLYCRLVRPNALLSDYEPQIHSNGRFLLQHGISRTNCVDCLDRTNVAQFVIGTFFVTCEIIWFVVSGKVALGLQLYSMGFVDEPVLLLSSEVCRIYEDLMDEHGDKLALQYAGSQLVHSIKTYKKISAFQERSRDVIQTLSRYYSNTFGDYDKQNAINLFLGVFRPGSLPHLWDYATDYYLHFPIGYRNTADYCQWYVGSEQEVCPPNGRRKITVDSDISNDFASDAHDSDSITTQVLLNEDAFDEYYRVWELSNFDVLIREQRDLQKSVTVDGINQSVAQSYSFAKLWKTYCIFGSQVVKSAHSLLQQETSGQSKSSGVKQKKSTLADDDDDEDEPIVKWDAEVHYEPEFDAVRLISNQSRGWVMLLIVLQITLRNRHQNDWNRAKMRRSVEIVPVNENKGLSTGLKSTMETYGFTLKMPNDVDMQKYSKYVRLGGTKLDSEDWHAFKPKRLSDLSVPGIEDYRRLKPLSVYTADNIFQTEMPEVSKASMRVYVETANFTGHGTKAPSSSDMNSYERYSPAKRHSASNLLHTSIKIDDRAHQIVVF